MKRGHSMRAWVRRMALRRTYHRLRDFEGTATREDIADFTRALHETPACVSPDGQLLVDVRDARAMADACAIKLQGSGPHSRGRRLGLEITGAVLDGLARGEAITAPELRFMASLLADLNAPPMASLIAGEESHGPDVCGEEQLTIP